MGAYPAGTNQGASGSQASSIHWPACPDSDLDPRRPPFTSEEPAQAGAFASSAESVGERDISGAATVGKRGSNLPIWLAGGICGPPEITLRSHVFVPRQPELVRRRFARRPSRECTCRPSWATVTNSRAREMAVADDAWTELSSAFSETAAYQAAEQPNWRCMHAARSRHARFPCD